MFKSSLLLAGAAGLAQAYTNTDVSQFMMKNIDPIVMPGRYQSHMHSFFGSDAVNVNMSTSAELQAGCATAKNPNDFSVYWIPTLYHVDGDKRTAIAPKRFTAYYNFEKTQAETAIPQDFSVLAGNAAAKSKDDLISSAEVTWLCQGQKFDAGGKEHAQFPLSTCSNNVLQAVLWFPDCVNPETLESDYSSGGKCPSGMKTMPQLRFSIRYDIKSVGSWSGGEPPLELACGPSWCFHGDFINGWLPETAEKMVTALTKERSFQSLDGPNGKTKAGSVCKTKATDADPGNGTNDYEESLTMMGEDGSGSVNATAASASASQSDDVDNSCESSSSKRTIGQKFRNRQRNTRKL